MKKFLLLILVFTCQAFPSDWYLGQSPGSNETYGLRTGALNYDFMYIGYHGSGKLYQLNQFQTSVNASAIGMGVYSGSYGYYEMRAGTANTIALALGNGGNAEFKQLGGNCMISSLRISYDGADANLTGGTGLYSLLAGSLEVGNQFEINSAGRINITDGILTLSGNRTNLIDDYFDAGKITAFDGLGRLDISTYLVGNETYTKVVATPEPATVLLLVLGIAISRKK